MTHIDRRALIMASATLGLAACTSMPSKAAPPAKLLIDLDRQPDEVVSLWPTQPPGGTSQSLNEHYVERDNRFGLYDRAAHEVTDPTLSLFRASDPDGSAIIIIPGGGYKWVVVEKEGYEGARYFNAQRSHVYVLKYRLPHQGWAGGSDAPLQDAQRAMRLIRSRSERDGVDPKRLMVMGFSAGGHLAGSLCQRFDAPVYAPIDDIDRLSARPDFGVLVYPVVLMSAPHAHEGSRIHLIGKTPSSATYAKYDLTTAPAPDGPPLFLLHTLDDKAVPVENTLQLASAARRAGVSASVHIFDEGGHGFGLRGIENTPVEKWPQLVIDWARARGFSGHKA